MTDLVTDAAINAASKARWQTGLDWLHGKEETPDTSLRNQLEAAAPLIAAEALRQAAQKLFADRAARGTGYVSREVSDYLDGIEVSAETLIALADVLEGK